MAAGIILCGGRSSRMGQPKAWLEFQGEYLLNRMVRILSVHLSPIVVVAAVGQELPPMSLPVTVVHDEQPDGGPMHGLYAGLKCLKQIAETTYLTACDVPLLQPEFVKFIVDSLGIHDAAVPLVDGIPQPLASAYRVDTILQLLPSLLVSSHYGLRNIFPVMSTKYLQDQQLRGIDPQLDSLRNANTPEEWMAIISEVSASHRERP